MQPHLSKYTITAFDSDNNTIDMHLDSLTELQTISATLTNDIRLHYHSRTVYKIDLPKKISKLIIDHADKRYCKELLNLTLTACDKMFTTVKTFYYEAAKEKDNNTVTYKLPQPKFLKKAENEISEI